MEAALDWLLVAVVLLWWDVGMEVALGGWMVATVVIWKLRCWTGGGGGCGWMVLVEVVGEWLLLRCWADGGCG